MLFFWDKNEKWRDLIKINSSEWQMFMEVVKVIFWKLEQLLLPRK